MKTKTKKFQMRLSPDEISTLYKLAEREGVSSSAWLVNRIRAEAKKKGIRP